MYECVCVCEVCSKMIECEDIFIETEIINDVKFLKHNPFDHQLIYLIKFYVF